MTNLASDYAEALRGIRDLVRSLGPDRHDPHLFHETKDAAVKRIDQLADEVEIDQVFLSRPARPAPDRGALGSSRTVYDRNRRPVPVEVRRPKRMAGR